MTQLTDEIMALADAYANAVCAQGEAHDHVARDALKAAVEKLGAQEPLFWVWRFPDGTFGSRGLSEHGCRNTSSLHAPGGPVPVYAHPVPVQQAPIGRVLAYAYGPDGATATVAIENNPFNAGTEKMHQGMLLYTRATPVQQEKS